MAERQPSKLNVASSNLVSRSTFEIGLRAFFGKQRAGVAQQVEHVLGKDEVTGSNPVVGLVRFLLTGSTVGFHVV